MSRTITLSYSELDTWRQCPFKHQLAYGERWKRLDPSAPLKRGTAWHQILEHHYRLLQQVQRGQLALADLKDLLHEGIDPILEDARTIPHNQDWVGNEGHLLEWMYTGYVSEFGTDKDWTIEAVEHHGEFWLPTDRGTRSRIKIKMKLDLIVRDEKDRLWVVDHKTAKDLPKDKEFDIDDQFGLYIWGMRQLGFPVFGAIHSATRTTMLKTREMEADERFLRHPMFRTDAELDTIAVEAYKTARNAYGAKNYDGDAPRAPDTDRCKWRCDFTEACLFGRKGNDTRAFLTDTGYVQDFTRH